MIMSRARVSSMLKLATNASESFRTLSSAVAPAKSWFLGFWVPSDYRHDCCEVLEHPVEVPRGDGLSRT